MINIAKKLIIITLIISYVAFWILCYIATSSISEVIGVTAALFALNLIAIIIVNIEIENKENEKRIK